MMKYLGVFILGVLVTTFIGFSFKANEPLSDRESAIVIKVINDLDSILSEVSLHHNKGIVTQSNIDGRDILFILKGNRDYGFYVTAKTESGEYSSNKEIKYYAEPGTTHVINVSSLK